MRDLDDVSDNLIAIRDRVAVAYNDAPQRITDLGGADLVQKHDGTAELTQLGEAVLDDWIKWDVANVNPDDELARTIILYGQGQKLNVSRYRDFSAYWSELRASFEPYQLIDSWDALYVLNYLDHRIDGFAPGDSFRDEAVPVDEVEYDLDDLAESMGASDRVRKGAEQLRRAIEGKVPRGRARATACLAMELLFLGSERRAPLIAATGQPMRPRQWTTLSAEGAKKALEVCASFDHWDSVKGRMSVHRRNQVPVASARPSWDYAAARREAPPRVQPPRTRMDKGGRPKKVDYQRRQERNSEVGRIGEEFAVGYERWRLSAKPNLANAIEHVALTDDTLGYDIRSFDLNGASRYVEVKATEGPLTTRFFLTANELAYAESHPDQYVLLRVSDLRGSPECYELRFPFSEIELRPTVYECTFRPNQTDGSTSTVG